MLTTDFRRAAFELFGKPKGEPRTGRNRVVSGDQNRLQGAPPAAAVSQLQCGCANLDAVFAYLKWSPGFKSVRRVYYTVCESSSSNVRLFNKIIITTKSVIQSHRVLL